MLDAAVTSQSSIDSSIAPQDREAVEICKRIKDAVAKGIVDRDVQSIPHLVLMSPTFYGDNLRNAFGRWAVVYLMANTSMRMTLGLPVAGKTAVDETANAADREPKNKDTSSGAVGKAAQAARKRMRLAFQLTNTLQAGQSQREQDKQKEMQTRAALHNFVTKHGAADAVWRGEQGAATDDGTSAKSEDKTSSSQAKETFDALISDAIDGKVEGAKGHIEMATKLANLARDWVCSYLPHCLGKRNRVDYGLISTSDIIGWHALHQGSGTGRSMNSTEPKHPDEHRDYTEDDGIKVRLAPGKSGSHLRSDDDQSIGIIIYNDHSSVPFRVKALDTGRSEWFYASDLILVPMAVSEMEERMSEFEIVQGDDLNPKSRKLLAIPFSGKDTPSPKSEFSSPEILIGLTFLAYRYSGLREYDLYRLLNRLIETMKTQAGPFANRPSHRKFARWIQAAEAIHVTATDESPDVEVLSLDLFEPKDAKQMHSAHKALSLLGEAAIEYMKTLVFPEVMKHQSLKLQASGMDLGSDMLFGTRLGFSGTPSDLMPYSLGSVGVQPGTDAKVLRVLTSQELVQIASGDLAVPDEWSVESILEQIATSTKPEFHAMVDAGALITGFSNEGTARFLLQRLRPEIKGCAFLDSANNTMILMREDNRIVRLQDCGLSLEERFSFYDQVHSTGTDIKQCAQACCAVTLGKGMTLRDLAQGAWRMRGLTLGQRITLIIVPEVQKQIDPTVHTEKATDMEMRLRKVVEWLLYNSADSEQKQYLQLLGQQAANLYRSRAFDELIQSSLPDLPPSKWSVLADKAEQTLKDTHVTDDSEILSCHTCSEPMLWVEAAPGYHSEKRIYVTNSKDTNWGIRWRSGSGFDPMVIESIDSGSQAERLRCSDDSKMTPGLRLVEINGVDVVRRSNEQCFEMIQDQGRPQAFGFVKLKAKPQTGLDNFACTNCYHSGEGYRWNCDRCMVDLCPDCCQRYPELKAFVPSSCRSAISSDGPLFTSRFYGGAGFELSKQETAYAASYMQGKDPEVLLLGADREEKLPLPHNFVEPTFDAPCLSPPESARKEKARVHVGSSEVQRSLDLEQAIQRMSRTVRSLPTSMRVGESFWEAFREQVADMRGCDEHVLTDDQCAAIDNILFKELPPSCYAPPTFLLDEKERDGWLRRCSQLSEAAGIKAPSGSCRLNTIGMLMSDGHLLSLNNRCTFANACESGGGRLMVHCWGEAKRGQPFVSLQDVASHRFLSLVKPVDMQPDSTSAGSGVESLAPTCDKCSGAMSWTMLGYTEYGCDCGQDSCCGGGTGLRWCCTTCQTDINPTCVTSRFWSNRVGDGERLAVQCFRDGQIALRGTYPDAQYLRVSPSGRWTLDGDESGATRFMLLDLPRPIEHTTSHIPSLSAVAKDGCLFGQPQSATPRRCLESESDTKVAPQSRVSYAEPEPPPAFRLHPTTSVNDVRYRSQRSSETESTALLSSGSDCFLCSASSGLWCVFDMGEARHFARVRQT